MMVFQVASASLAKWGVSPKILVLVGGGISSFGVFLSATR
jgi:hypothetical protein